MPRARGEATTVMGAFLLYGAVFFDRLAPLYLVGLIAADLGVPSAAEGTLALCLGLGWAAAMPLVRATSGWWDDRTRILGAVVVSGTLGLVSATAGGWLVFVLLRGLGGLAVSSGGPAVTSLVFSAAPPDRRGRDLGIVQSSTRLMGSLVSPIVVTAVAVVASWRIALLVSAGALLLGAAMLAVLVPAAPGGATRRPRRHDFTYRPGGRRTILLCTLGCILLLGWLTVWSQTSVAVVRDWLELDPDAAGRYVGLFGVGAAAAALLLPVVSDRIGRRAALALAGVLGGTGGVAVGALAMAGARPPVAVVWAALFLAGTAMGGLPLVISIVPAEAVATGDVGRALTGPIAGGEVIGAAALPALAAWAAVPLGRPAVLVAAAVGVLGLVVVARLLRLPAPPGPREP